MGSISTFGGVSATPGSGSGSGGGGGSAVDPMVIGQVIQAAGGLNLLPADGRILPRSQYPIAYSALQNDLMEVNTLPINIQPMAVGVSAAGATCPAAYCKDSGILAMLATGGTVNVSTDQGKTWQNYPMPLTADNATPTWNAIVANDSKFCAVSNRFSATSVDGINWIVGPTFAAFAPFNATCTFAWTGTEFLYFGTQTTVGGGSSAGSICLSSADGLTWDNRGAIPISRITRILKLANGSYFAYGLNTNQTSAINVVATSTDGENWTQRLLPSAETFLGVASIGNTITMLTTTKCIVSTDGGITWTSNAIAGGIFTGITSLSSLASTENTFILTAVTTGGQTAGVYKSTDGFTWTTLTSFNAGAQVSNPMFASDNAGTIAYPAGHCVMVSKDEGLTWNGYVPANVANPNWNSIIWTGSFFLVSCNTQTTTYKSTDGITWTLGGTIPTLTGVANIYHFSPLFNLHYLMTGAIATTGCLTSPDGIVWTSRTLPSSYIIFGIVTFAGKVIIANGYAGNHVSTNGTTFTAGTGSSGTHYIAASPTIAIKMISPGFNAGTPFTTVNNYHTSPDGVTWTARTAAAAGLVLPAGVTSFSPSNLVWTGTHFIYFCVASGTNFAWTSTDGLNWTLVTNLLSQPPGESLTTPNADYAVRPVLYGTNGLAFMARGPGSGAAVNMYFVFTKDLITWTTQPNPVPRGSTLGLIFANATPVGGGNELYAIDGNIQYRYVDGANTLQMKGLTMNGLGTNRSWTVIKTDSMYFAYVPASSFCAKSSDGLNWTWITSIDGANPILDCVSLGSKAMFTTANATVTTTDGVEFIRLNHISASGTSARRISVAGSKVWMTFTMSALSLQNHSYAALYDGGLNFISRVPFFSGSIGNAFATQYARNGDQMIFGSMSESGVSVSMDKGATWTQRSLGTGYNICSVTYSERMKMYIAVPQGSTSPTTHTTIYTSLDGIRWTPRVLPSSQRWSSVVECGNLLFVMAGSSGSATNVWAYSLDGIRWTQITTPISSDWNFAVPTDRSFVALGAAGGFNLGLYGRFHDPETEFQLPYYPFVLGAPSWFMKVK